MESMSLDSDNDESAASDKHVNKTPEYKIRQNLTKHQLKDKVLKMAEKLAKK